MLDRLDSEQTVQQYDEIMDIARQEQIISQCFTPTLVDGLPASGGEVEQAMQPPQQVESHGIDANSSILRGAEHLTFDNVSGGVNAPNKGPAPEQLLDNPPLAVQIGGQSIKMSSNENSRVQLREKYVEGGVASQQIKIIEEGQEVEVPPLTTPSNVEAGGVANNNFPF